MASAIRTRRKQLGLSQGLLAQKANVSTAYVRILDGGFLPSSADPLDTPAYNRVVRTLDELEQKNGKK